ncbi:hypothetical protein JCM10556A_21120 [Bacteroides acidifaciens]
MYGIITVYLCHNNRPTQKHAGQIKINNENNTNQRRRQGKYSADVKNRTARRADESGN